MELLPFGTDLFYLSSRKKSRNMIEAPKGWSILLFETASPSVRAPRSSTSGCCTCRFALAVPAVVAGDEHVDGGDDEEGEERADEQTSNQNQAYGVTSGCAGAGDEGQRKVAGD